MRVLHFTKLHVTHSNGNKGEIHPPTHNPVPYDTLLSNTVKQFSTSSRHAHQVRLCHEAERLPRRSVLSTPRPPPVRHRPPPRRCAHGPS